MADYPSRKLAVILHADVVGSTELVQRDESLAHGRIQDSFRRFSETIKAYGGMTQEIRGDALVAEFARASDAVIAAIAFQIENADSNAQIEDDIQPELRIGISLGEVIVADNTVTGTGIVLAQRLEQLAIPGGVVVQGSVSETVPNRLPFDFESLGEQTLKGFDEPVRAFVVNLKSGERVPEPESNAATLEVGSDVDRRRTPLELPDKPSIAVLPFTNMSGNPEQEHFSDGITEDIITALSKINSLLVVARNSTFTYKGQAVDVKQVSREQGVRYVLEGSVRKAGSRVRVTAQLIDATTGHHLWAERYDRDLEDIFAVQDEITREVVIALDVRLSGGEQARFWSSGTKNLEAWECVRQGMDVLNRGTQESVQECLRLCKKALELDPNYAMAWVTLGWAHHHGVDVGLGHALEESREAGLGSALNCGNRAIELDPSCADAYSLLSFCHLSRGEYDEAIAMSQKAVALAPNHSEILALSAVVQNKSGHPDRGLELTKKAMRLCPIYPGWYFEVLGAAYRLMGNTDSAVDAYKAAIKGDADFLGMHVGLASTLGELGRQQDAKTPVAEILRLDPDFSIRTYVEGLSYRDPAALARFEDGLRKAGLPE